MPEFVEPLDIQNCDKSYISNLKSTYAKIITSESALFYNNFFPFQPIFTLFVVKS